MKLARDETWTGLLDTKEWFKIAGWSSGSSSGSYPEGRGFESRPRYYFISLTIRWPPTAPLTGGAVFLLPRSSPSDLYAS